MPRVSCCPDVRQAVLEAALALMKRYGYKKMTIDDLASECGIGKATLYGYFRNKQEVGLAVIDHYHRNIQEEYRRIIVLNLPASQKLRMMIEHRVLYLFEVAQGHHQSLDDCLAGLRPLVLQRRDYYADQESKLLAHVLREGMDSGEFQSDDANRLARTVLICTGGLMPLNLSPKELASRAQVASMTRQVIELLIRGLAVHRSDFDSDPSPIYFPLLTPTREEALQ